jgi:hypothetical protein
LLLLLLLLLLQYSQQKLIMIKDQSTSSLNVYLSSAITHKEIEPNFLQLFS